MREIARRCGVAPSTVSRTIDRARANLVRIRRNAEAMSRQIDEYGRAKLR